MAGFNATTLQGMERIKIEWTTCLTDHLNFDPARLDPISGNMTPALKLFRYQGLLLSARPRVVPCYVGKRGPFDLFFHLFYLFWFAL